MTAPTPISALLHSSTMVIAGVYLGIGLQVILLIILDNNLIVSLFSLLGIIVPFLYSLFKAISTNDIKSIIACSTISQISYMFLALIISPIYSLYHILVHALFKSLLFLLGGSLIQTQLNQQSIGRMRNNNICSYITILSLTLIMIITISKEGIIQCLSYISFYYLYFFSLIGTLFTILYSIKILFYCFNYLNNQSLGYLAIIVNLILISSLIIDEIVEYYFLFYGTYFITLISLINYSSFSLFPFSITIPIYTFLNIYLG